MTRYGTGQVADGGDGGDTAVSLFNPRFQQFGNCEPSLPVQLYNAQARVSTVRLCKPR